MNNLKYFCDIDNRPAKQLAPGVTIKTFWGDKMMLSLVAFEPNGVVKMHSHPHEQSGVCLEGEFTMIIGGERRLLRPGDTYIIPGGIEHSAIAHDNPAKALDVFSPVREEYQY